MSGESLRQLRCHYLELALLLGLDAQNLKYTSFWASPKWGSAGRMVRPAWLNAAARREGPRSVPATGPKPMPPPAGAE